MPKVEKTRKDQPEVKKDLLPKRRKTGGFCVAVGRRKRATAKVKLLPKIIREEEAVTVNGLPWLSYFSERPLAAKKVLSPLRATGLLGKLSFNVNVSGGGKSGQVDAVTLGIARTLVDFDGSLKPVLRREGLLTRDPREKERKKPGFLRARKKPQFSKR